MRYTKRLADQLLLGISEDKRLEDYFEETEDPKIRLSSFSNQLQILDQSNRFLASGAGAVYVLGDDSATPLDMNNPSEKGRIEEIIQQEGTDGLISSALFKDKRFSFRSNVTSVREQTKTSRDKGAIVVQTNQPLFIDDRVENMVNFFLHKYNLSAGNKERTNMVQNMANLLMSYYTSFSAVRNAHDFLEKEKPGKFPQIVAAEYLYFFVTELMNQHIILDINQRDKSQFEKYLTTIPTKNGKYKKLIRYDPAVRYNEMDIRSFNNIDTENLRRFMKKFGGLQITANITNLLRTVTDKECEVLSNKYKNGSLEPNLRKYLVGDEEAKGILQKKGIIGKKGEDKAWAFYTGPFIRVLGDYYADKCSLKYPSMMVNYIKIADALSDYIHALREPVHAITEVERIKTIKDSLETRDKAFVLRNILKKLFNYTKPEKMDELLSISPLQLDNVIPFKYAEKAA